MYIVMESNRFAIQSMLEYVVFLVEIKFRKVYFISKKHVYFPSEKTIL